jgi:hypothetical protein
MLQVRAQQLQLAQQQLVQQQQLLQQQLVHGHTQSQPVPASMAPQPHVPPSLAPQPPSMQPQVPQSMQPQVPQVPQALPQPIPPHVAAAVSAYGTAPPARYAPPPHPAMAPSGHPAHAAPAHTPAAQAGYAPAYPYADAAAAKRETTPRVFSPRDAEPTPPAGYPVPPPRADPPTPTSLDLRPHRGTSPAADSDSPPPPPARMRTAELGHDEEGKTIQLSFASHAHALALSIEEYAALCAERDVAPERAIETEQRYDVYDARGREIVERAFELRFRREPALRERWQQAYREFVGMLRRPPP